MASTLRSSSRFWSRNAAKAASNPASRLSSLSGIHNLPKFLDPAVELDRAGLQRGAIDDEARGDVEDFLNIHQPVSLQCCACRDKINDAAAKPEAGGKLHRTGKLDAFRLDPCLGKEFMRQVRVFRRNADMAPAAGIAVLFHIDGLGDGNMAMPDVEINRGIDFGIVEFQQHIVARDTKLRRAEGNEGR